MTNISCRRGSFECISSICWAYFSEQFHQDWESCSGSDGQQTTKQWPGPLFGASLALGSALGLLLGLSTELGVTSCLYKIHYLSHVTIQSRNGSLLFSTIREDDSSKWQFFFIIGQFKRHLLFKLFHLSNLLHVPNERRMIDAEFFGNFSRSLRGTASMMDLNWLLSTPNGWLMHSSSSWTTTALYVHQQFLGQMRLLVLQVVSTALWPILNSKKKKITRILCLSNIISIVQSQSLTKKPKETRIKMRYIT